MEKGAPTEIAHEELSIDGKPNFSNGDQVEAKLAVDDSLEHEITVKYMFKNHKGLIAWTCFWATCSIGWGFDAQVNGAMIGVPSFRRDFG